MVNQARLLHTAPGGEEREAGEETERRVEEKGRRGSGGG